MRTTGFRSIVLYILLVCFLGGAGFLFLKFCLDGDDWVTKPYNGHIYAEDATAAAGAVTDRNQVLLAKTVDGSRVYSENSEIRRALLHTVGDSSGYIGTSVQSEYLPKLMGYNPVTGLNPLPLNGFGLKQVTLTVDAELCAAAYRDLSGRNGAVLIYNYKTGEILCKVSAPGYDPMNVPEDLTENDEYRGVFVDNTISSAYTPGSIFKIVTALCAMENLPDWQSRRYTCEQEFTIGGDTLTCLGWHGDQDLEEALGNSCNIYFARLALELGPERLQATAEELGFNRSFSFTDFSTAPSEIDLSHIEQINLGWAGIGQYTLTVNPAHMMCLMGAIANGGSFAEPYLVEGSAHAAQKETLLSARNTAALKELLRNNVVYYYGDYLFPELEVCAKTGTAEVGEEKEPTSWIVGFSDSEETPYAFAIAVEEGGSGLGTAGNIASDLLILARDRGL